MSNHVNCCKFYARSMPICIMKVTALQQQRHCHCALTPHDAQHVLGILAFDHRGHLGTSQVQEALDVQVIGRKDQFKQNLPMVLWEE